jgi:dienelactone hydrolase
MKMNHFPKVRLISSLLCLSSMFVQMSGAKEKVPPTKSIRGHVVDAKKRSIAGAKVFIRNLKKNTTTVLVTDESGLYATYGLDPKVDYEVHAEHGGFVSEKRSVSSFLNRFDNVFTFELGAGEVGGSPTAAQPVGKEMTLLTADGVKLAATWFSPVGKKEMKSPAVLLVHGFGQDSGIWGPFIKDHLLPAGFAALNLNLRGHGNSLERAGTRISAERSWVSDPRQFPQDIAAAVQWLKSRSDVDVNRIGMLGSDIGANLAFLASGKYEEIRSAVALSGDVEAAKRLAAGIENFQPHSILYVATQGDSAAADSARQFEKLTGFPVRVEIYENSAAHGVQILQDIPAALLLLMDWLKKI